jgi:Chitobiase/beta-hexosaminidase C-terminal domain
MVQATKASILQIMILNMNLLSKGGSSLADIKNVMLGLTQVQKIYAGTDLVFEKIIDATAPITSIRPFDAINNPTNTYTAAQTVYLDCNEMADTYYTLDGSDPTTASTLYTGNGIAIDATTTIKYFSVDLAGNAEAIKTTTYTINAPSAPAFPRYIRFIGYGDNVSAATTRLVELQVMFGATNLLLNKLPISGEAVSTGGTIDKATDGIITMSGYPIWWNGAGIPTLVYDLGDWYDVTQVKVWMYSTAGDPRQTKFKIDISADNVAWFNVVDYSANTTAQPVDGWIFNI